MFQKKEGFGTKPGLSWDQVGTKLDLSFDDVKKVLDFCISSRRLVDVINHMGLSNRTKFKQKYFNPLLQEGLLEMTNPQKPNSPNQKYATSASGRDLMKRGVD